jgi:hypothetical protein
MGLYQLGQDGHGQSAHGVVMLRGWARTGHRAPGRRREGHVIPLFQHSTNRLAAAERHLYQYMFVTVHEEGQEAVRRVPRQKQAQVMSEVPDGRMGHRQQTIAPRCRLRTSKDRQIPGTRTRDQGAAGTG